MVLVTAITALDSLSDIMLVRVNSLHVARASYMMTG